MALDEQVFWNDWGNQNWSDILMPMWGQRGAILLLISMDLCLPPLQTPYWLGCAILLLYLFTDYICRYGGAITYGTVPYALYWYRQPCC